LNPYPANVEKMVSS